ncbi:MAG: NTP transferase domain-containing protein [Candidatus Levybacteria bacterium]|nr:NTP transferase domain-containing protein [Candidatus Levybacteria bacterium]
MQAVILSAGESTRFNPFRYFDHKSLIKILGKEILIHTIESIKKSGITDIIIVVSKKEGIKNLLGDGRKFGVKIKYILQEEPTGAGNGLLLASNLIKGDFFLLNASHIDFDEFKNQMVKKKSVKDKAIFLAKKQKELSKFGVLKTDKDRVVGLIEKPQEGKEPSDLRLIGIYLFSKDFLKTLSKIPDEHYRLESAISSFVKKEQVRFVETKIDVPSLKYAWDILEMKNYLLSKAKSSRGKNISLSKSAEVIGKVIIEDNAVIMEGARIKGPCFIGANTMIGNNAILRGNADIEENCIIGANMEVKNSLIMQGTKVHSGFIGDSVIGENCHIGAFFSTANVRLDRKTVKVNIKEKDIDSGLKFLGTLIGGNAKIGIKASTMPGIIIGTNSIIGPSTVVLNNVSENSKYYTKFKEIVVRNEA